jgi:perosamine synthetase
MKQRIVPHVGPWLGKEEIKQVTESINNNWITGGPKLKEFQEKIAKLCGVKHGIAVCNGTQALYVGLCILGIGKGDEVIVPDFTFIASANAVFWTGAKPVFVDIDRKTFNIDPKKIEALITKKTKAIMPVHIYGQSANMPEIMKIARKHKLYVIEDAAQGIKVTYGGKPTGSFGEVGCMSFYGDKVLTTGEGGMVLTNDDKLAERAVILLNQGRTGRGWYVHDYMGYNFRMTDLQAGIGLAQLKKLPEIIKRRKRIEKLYKELLAKVPGVELPHRDSRGFNVPFRYTVLVKDPQALSDYLTTQGIKTARSFYPLHLQPCYKGSRGSFPNSIYAYEHLLRLPSGNILTESDMRYVCAKIKDFYKNDRKA